MVWVTYYLTLRPHSQDSLRGEINKIVGYTDKEDSTSVLDYSDLQKAVLTDSFFREVLRMKGDSVNVVRSSVRDVELGGYTIPKGLTPIPSSLTA
jgi:cytochrome P450